MGSGQMSLPVKQKMFRWRDSFVSLFFNVAIIICVLVLISHLDSWKIEKQSVMSSRLESMVQRREYFDSICEKYKSPTRCKKFCISNSLCVTVCLFVSRIEYRGLYRTYPPVHHFSQFALKGKDHLTCNIYKVGSNSWNIYIARIQRELRKYETVAENSESSILGDCWPACAVK